MPNSLYVTGIEAQSGKALVALALMEQLSGKVARVSVFRPVVSENGASDPLITFMMDLYRLPFSPEEMYGTTLESARTLLSEGKYDDLYSNILDRYKSLENRCDFVLCVGTDHTGVSMALEFDFNVEIARNLGSPIVALINGKDMNQVRIANAVQVISESLEKKECDLAAFIVNRVEPGQQEELVTAIKTDFSGTVPVYVIPEDPLLERRTIREIAKGLGAELVSENTDRLDSEVTNVKIGAMELPNFLDRLENGALVITPGDRSDIIIGTLAADRSNNYPHIAGLLLSGNLKLAPQVKKLAEGLLASPVPVIATEMDTFSAAMRVSEVRPSFTAENKRKIAEALGLVESSVDIPFILERAAVTRSGRVTPLMFQYEIIHRAKQRRVHIVLPEGAEERILKAAEIALLRGICDITLLGNVEEVRQKASALGLSLNDIRVIDPQTSELRSTFANKYYEMRRNKGISRDMAEDTMADVSYFGTMMVHLGLADGMVSGSVHTTPHTIRPALEFVKTRPGISIVSSVFFMCLADRVLVYGDCAVVPEPTAAQLADIAISSATTASAFGIEPRVAMLSYSTGESGTGPDVDRVKEATQMVRERQPDLLVEGPIQYDAAIDPTVGKAKMPGSKVAGLATVFIFPDLSAGNNAYKAVQRAANAIAVGPVLQGLNKPVNDLSRGALVPDIVNTIAITAIQSKLGEVST